MTYKKWECIACGYIYDEELGEENYYHLFDDIRNANGFNP